MNKKALRILEYNKITELLAAKAGSAGGRRMALELEPRSDQHFIADEQRATTEARTLITHKGPLPVGGIHDIDRSVSFAAKGGSLNMKKLLEVKSELEAAEGAAPELSASSRLLGKISNLILNRW